MSAIPKILRRSHDAEPGISRIKRGKGWSYHQPNGKLIKDSECLERIQTLGIPPAYEHVWICIDPHGHLQATGLDQSGRKQYRYHADWSAFRARKKYDCLIGFGHHLPALRRKIRRDLKQEADSKRFVCAALIRLMDKTAIRIGSPQYTKANGSFGATTLRRKHFKHSEGRLSLDYKAKGGKRIRRTLSDKTLARVLEKIDELPGYVLFQYRSVNGEICRLDSSDVNDYIGEDFSAKTFRTWQGSVSAYKAFCQSETPTIKSLSEAAAETLFNTATICRKSYIHPKIIDLVALSRDNQKRIKNQYRGSQSRGLRKYEAQCLAFINEAGRKNAP